MRSSLDMSMHRRTIQNANTDTHITLCTIYTTMSLISDLVDMISYTNKNK
jgi:hypothetical protein